VVVSTVASQQEGCWFDPFDPFCAEFACSPRVSVASSHSPKTCRLGTRLIGNSKLSVGVNVSVNGCLSLCVSPAIVWRPVQGVPCLSPDVAGIGSSPPATLKRMKRLEDEWRWTSTELQSCDNSPPSLIPNSKARESRDKRTCTSAALSRKEKLKAFTVAGATSWRPYLSCSILIFIVSSSETCVSSALHLLEPLRSIFSPGRSSLRCFPNLEHKKGSKLQLTKIIALFLYFFVLAVNHSSQVTGVVTRADQFPSQ